MKKGRQLAVIVALWILGGIHVAAAEKEAFVTTDIQSGGVSIRMNRYGDTEKKQEWEDVKDILPGQEIPMIMEIENLGEDCFIRYRVRTESKSNQEISSASFRGLPDDCVQKGEYFYDMEILKHGEKEELFASFLLPENWEQEEEDEIHIYVTADAVQSRNFTPDFESENPWGDITIQKVSEEDKENQLRVAVPQKGLCRVVVEGDKIITVPDGFFSEMGTVVPGDTIQGEIQIENGCKQSEAVYWKLESEEHELLNSVELKIERSNGAILYQGTVQEYQTDRFALLERYAQDEKDSLLFTLYFPEEMDNLYRLLNAQMTWTFRAISETQEADFLQEERQETVKTGEESHLFLFLLLIGSASLVFVLIRKRRPDE